MQVSGRLKKRFFATRHFFANEIFQYTLASSVRYFTIQLEKREHIHMHTHGLGSCLILFSQSRCSLNIYELNSTHSFALLHSIWSFVGFTRTIFHSLLLFFVRKIKKSLSLFLSLLLLTLYCTLSAGNQTGMVERVYL